MKIVPVLVAALLASACGQPPLPVEPGVSLELAEHRAAILSNIHYALRFKIPRDSSADIAAMGNIHFDLSENTRPLQLDFRETNERINRLTVNGKLTPYEFRDEHIVIPGSALRVGRNSIEIDFIAGSSSLNRNPDYLYTLFVPDRARTAFPLFDQPDLKATYELTLDLPAEWVALSNAPVASIKREEKRAEYRFATTDLMSSYLFSFVAGKFETITRERRGRFCSMRTGWVTACSRQIFAIWRAGSS